VLQGKRQEKCQAIVEKEAERGSEAGKGCGSADNYYSTVFEV
jgi:hypothetical protein